KGSAAVARAADGLAPGAGRHRTVAAIGVVWTSEPLFAVTVTAYDPAVVPVNVHVDAWLPLMDDGAQEPVTPEGADAKPRATLPVKPPVEVSVIVEVPDCPGMNDTLAGFAAIEKSGTGGP